MNFIKKATAIILAAALILPTLAGCTNSGAPAVIGAADITTGARSFAPFQPSGANALAATLPSFADHNFAEEDLVPRDGYILVPTMFGTTGIDTLSSFFLVSPYENAAVPSISIDGQAAPTISRDSGDTFLITPATPLRSNAVYVFRLSREGQPDITWAFQTTVRFEIMSTLPRNQAINVPVRTGIEFNFSAGEEIDIADYFSIYPHVAGRFIHQGSTAIFMPTAALQHMQVYTVTLRAGVSLPGTTEALTQDFVFAFETAPRVEPVQHNWPSRIDFSAGYIEFPSFEAPQVNFWLSYNSRTTTRPTIQVGVYRFGNQQQAIDTLSNFINTPSWARISWDNRLIDTAPLTQVSSFTITERVSESRWGAETLTLPSSLDPGFYIIDAYIGGHRDQVILQVTDLAIQVVADDNMALLWIHNMNTTLPAAGAIVGDLVYGATYTATDYGIAVVERQLNFGDYLTISAGGTESVVFILGGNMGISPRSWGWSPWSQGGNNDYWSVLQLDRTLFQRGDTLSLWGFVQNRHQLEEITHVTAVITENSWWGADRDNLVRQNIAVVDGAYNGEIRLPNLNPGFYQLTIYHGDIVLDSIFFDVQDYVKPPYQLTVDVCTPAIFAGDSVTFTANVSFFEGTPVPELDISYRLSGWNLRNTRQGRAETNINGAVEINTGQVLPNADAQGHTSLQFSAEATLPEIGWTHARASTRVFINDIHVQARATRTDANASLTVNVHDITLDRINNGTNAHFNDFLCAPTVGQTLNVEIIRVYWVRTRIGEFFDSWLRQVVPRYRHDRREEVIQQFTLTTDANGNATREFTVPDRRNESYLARVTTTDGNGRTITHTMFIGRDWSHFHNMAEGDSIFLYGARPQDEGYDIGDTVELTLMRGADPLETGRIMFVTVQNGILSYQVGGSNLTFTFEEKHAPNATAFAFHFNGHTYYSSWQTQQRLHFNSLSRQLMLEITTCQDEYRPSDTATITITTTDTDGNPKAANVNISLVDEALFALMDYNVNTLTALYRTVSDHLRINMATHRTFVSDGAEYAVAEMAADSADSDVVFRAAVSAPAPTAQANFSGAGEATHIRERFEDTAAFKSVATNANGTATITFQLPDNITAWRLTASGISNDLYAGNTVQNVRVTQPMFLHYTLGSTFLVGDTPSIGVNVFGTSLMGGENVAFDIWCESNPDYVRRASGRAFERINIPLWEMATEGIYRLVIYATVSNGLTDAVIHPFQVVDSHHFVDAARFYTVTQNTVFDVGNQGMTNITFTDHGRGQFLNNLLSMRWVRGARIEGLVASREATRLIEANFPEATIFRSATAFDILEYQQPDGGIAILPYASSNLYATVMLMPFILDEINVPMLRRYLQSIVDGGSSENRMLALYGLAMLGEPVLLELQRNAMLEGLSIRNTAYIALAFAALGEVQAANNIFDTRIAPHIQRVAPYYRVNTGTNNREIQETTSVVALLAATLGLPQSVALHNYATRRHTCNFTLNLERLAFIALEIENHHPAPASITYTLFGQQHTRNLTNWNNFTLRIPTQNLHEFSIVSVTGEVGAVSIVRTPLTDIEPVDNGITVSRQFFRAGTNQSATTFSQDELVRVQITVTYPATAVLGSYIITDILPAGLVHVANSARFGARSQTPGHWRHATTDGQRVSFFDHNSRHTGTHVYYYYARVISPGVFRAEGTIVQSVGAREYLTVGNEAVVTIVE